MTIERHLRIGTRGSALALAQTRLVIAALVERWKTLTCDVVVIRTQGDARADVPLAAIGGAGLRKAVPHRRRPKHQARI